MGVTGGGLHFEHAVGNFEHGDVEGAATEVEDQDGLLGRALVEAVGEGGRGGLVHDTKNFEAGDLSGFLSRGALRVVEVGGDRNHGLGDGFSEVGLGVTLQLHENASGNLLRGVLGAINVDGPVGTHVALHRANGALGVGDRLALGDFADQDFARL